MFDKKVFDITDAIQSLYPGSEWVLNGSEYSGLNWLSDSIEKPSEKELLAETNRLQVNYDALEYQRLRKPEYPPIEDYLDGIVKGDQDQIDKYIAECLSVKARFPKPSEES